MSIREHVVLLAGGVGGAKLAVGLAQVLPPEALSIIANTGDDFQHLGLHVSPDVDTLMYSLAGLANPATGWGVVNDTFQAMEMVRRYGGPAWFRLGDLDLGTNLMRTVLLSEGCTLTGATRRLCGALGVEQALLPMSDDPVRTILDTDEGPLAFQRYFVERQWQPEVRAIRFEGSRSARPGESVMNALDAATVIVFGPSNPYLSIDPILSVPGIREKIEAAQVPRVAVSPVIGGQAIKGPTVKLMKELGIDPSPVEIALHYRNLIDGIILDYADSALCPPIKALGVQATAQQTLMQSNEHKVLLAESLLAWLEEEIA
jgi:LPPG:FO 2-phospho-L-lactate transferase